MGVTPAAQGAGLSATIFFYRASKKIFPLLSLTQMQFQFKKYKVIRLFNHHSFRLFTSYATGLLTFAASQPMIAVFLVAPHLYPPNIPVE